MCYQVVERFSVCHCLYHKHGVDPCAAHGQRGHGVQEKTVLVGYACSAHTEHELESACRSRSEVQDIIIDDRNSTDGSDEGESVFSMAITTSRATSFIATQEEDTIEEVLQVLSNDPLLRWENLMCHQDGDTNRSNEKDVRFFLRAFENDLREAAVWTTDYHACALLRSRIRYLSSQVCKRFNLKEDTPWKSMTDRESSEQLKEITIQDPDITLVPIFSNIRSFMFDSVAFQALKENVRNFTRNTRDHLGEMVDIISRNVHPPEIIPMELSQAEGSGRSLDQTIKRFLTAVLLEAMIDRLSASDRVGIKNLNSKKLTTKLCALWTSGVPFWHFYPVVLVRSSCVPPQYPALNLRDDDSDVEIFESFICSSRAFLNLTESIARLPHKGFWSLRVSGILAPLYSQKLSVMSPGRDKTSIKFQCSCGETITDYYAETSTGGLRNKEKQLRLLSLRQKFYHAALERAQPRGAIATVRSFFTSSTRTIAPNRGHLPLHHISNPGSGMTQPKACDLQTQSDQHNHKFIHWCIPWTRYATHMYPLQACGINTDVDFFKSLREQYSQSKRRSQALLSFKQPVGLRFVKFRLYHDRLVDIHETADIPPESEKHEYEYSPMPADTIPPIGSNLLMHFFNHPDQAAPQPVLFPCIPKRKNNGLEPCPIRGSSIGWGIDVTTGINELKLFGLSLFLSLSSIFFGVAWAVAKSDIQGGFAVSGFMFAVFVSAIVSLKALDF